MLGAHGRSRAEEGLREAVRGSFFGVFLQVWCQFMSGSSCFDPVNPQDGNFTAKRKPKEDSDCGRFWSSAVSDNVMPTGLSGRAAAAG